MNLDTSNWSGEGTFTQALIDCLQQVDSVTFVRVEDAPATRSEADYNFISNEIFVSFATAISSDRVWRFGIFPGTHTSATKTMTVAGLGQVLNDSDGIGPPDYSDEKMLQYLKTERIIPPYQTRGYKLVELVRIYEVPAAEGKS